MIDFATLTGACVYALTERMSGVFTNRARARIRARRRPDAPAASASGTSPSRRTSTPSSRAGSPTSCSAPLDGKGDHILATRFLSRFVPADIPWAHVDLAAATRTGGLAHVSTDVTGFGVRFTLELLLRRDAVARAGEARA